MSTGIHPELRAVMVFLNKHAAVRTRIAAPPNKTIVYSGGVDSVQGVFRAWKMLADAKTQDPRRFDYVTLEERLRTLHVTDFGETLFEHANRVSRELERKGAGDQALILWRALSGIYVRGAVGRVRALVLPGPGIGKSVFSLTEVQVLLRPDVLSKIDIDANLLREFRTTVKAGLNPAPLVVF